jgi:hypothetical protein
MIFQLLITSSDIPYSYHSSELGTRYFSLCFDRGIKGDAVLFVYLRSGGRSTNGSGSSTPATFSTPTPFTCCH